jgi:hypothetical protein
MSIDAYPNAFTPAPCAGNVVAQRVATVMANSGNKSCFVMEWNFPVENEANLAANFSSARQVACIQETYREVEQVGGNGIMYFKFQKQSGIVAPKGGYSELDKEALKLISKMMSHDEDPLYLLEWLVHGLHLDYLEHRLPIVLEAYSQGAGLLMLNGTKRPGYYALESIFKS